MENIYNVNECIIFKRTHEPFGGLSNMAAGYPLNVIKGVKIQTVEALYQVCRFPDYPDIQQEIISCKSPMGAKMKSKKYKQFTRSDWTFVKENIMWWCLCLKLSHNKQKFGSLLESTNDKIIVEESHRDKFWGAIKDKKNPNVLVGENTLGKMLMQLRSEWRNNPDSFHLVHFIEIPHFKVLGNIIERDHCSIMRLKYMDMAFTYKSLSVDQGIENG
jgi:ribA/ribD-fused uncharacterized protein